MKKIYFIIGICFMFAAFTNAQNVAKKPAILTPVTSYNTPDKEKTATNIVKRCNTMEHLQEMIKNDPSFETKMQQNEKQTQQWIKENPDYSPKTVITVPVVVHIVYKTTAQNISDARVQEQINILNRDYSGLNPHSMGQFATSLKSNTELQFCLATKDPTGATTTGIERRQTTVSQFNGDEVKSYSSGGLNQWNHDKYMNIWVCNLGSSLCGYAEFPTPGLTSTYGVVIHYEFFGITGTTAPYNGGGTTTHEIGHCFNLYHIWGDDYGACSGDDLCGDTPNQGDNCINLCPTGVKTDNCTSTSPGIMYMNFMDYTNDACYANFTPNQKSRIQACFASGAPLYALKSSDGCQNPTPLPPVANFTASATSVAPGTTVTFTDLSTNTPTSWQWTLTPSTGFTYVSPTNSTSQNPQIKFNNLGCYTIALKATNSYGNNTCTKTNYVCVSNTPPAGSCDTLHYPMVGTPTIYSGSIGYLAGNNTYGDLAKADYFATYAPYTKITEAYFYFLVAKDGGSTTNITFKIWDNTGSGGSPGVVKGTATVPLSTIKADVAAQQATHVVFSPVVSIPGPFYVGVMLPTSTGDTLALLTNKNGDTNPGTGWELQKDNIWYAYSEPTPTGWGMNLQNAIWPIVCTTVDIHEKMLEDIHIFPNPATNELNIDFGSYNTDVKVKIYNALGTLINSVENKSISQLMKIDLSGYTSGIYYVNILTKDGTMTRKVSVIK